MRSLSILAELAALHEEKSAVSRILLSHAFADCVHAIALRDWLAESGWHDAFVDFDRHRGSAIDAASENALKETRHRFEAVLFVVSQAWLASPHCRRQFYLAERFNKKLLLVLIEDLRICELPKNLTEVSEIIRLVPAPD